MKAEDLQERLRRLQALLADADAAAWCFTWHEAVNREMREMFQAWLGRKLRPSELKP